MSEDKRGEHIAHAIECRQGEHVLFRSFGLGHIVDQNVRLTRSMVQSMVSTWYPSSVVIDVIREPAGEQIIDEIVIVPIMRWRLTLVSVLNPSVNKLSYIKAVKEITGLGLKQAKDIVDRAQAGTPQVVEEDMTDERKAKTDSILASYSIDTLGTEWIYEEYKVGEKPEHVKRIKKDSIGDFRYTVRCKGGQI